jgi:hypothetical protein
MRGRFEFAFYPLSPEAAVLGNIDPALALLGSQGWEIRGVTTLRDGAVLVALQRPLDEETPLPDASTLSASLAIRLTAPTVDELER